MYNIDVRRELIQLNYRPTALQIGIMLHVHLQ